MDFELVATQGTATALEGAEHTCKLAEQGTNVIDLMKDKRVDLLINTPSGPVARVDEIKIRSEAILRGYPLSTASGAKQLSVPFTPFVPKIGMFNPYKLSIAKNLKTLVAPV